VIDILASRVVDRADKPTDVAYKLRSPDNFRSNSRELEIEILGLRPTKME